MLFFSTDKLIKFLLKDRHKYLNCFRIILFIKYDENLDFKIELI